jgi:hypothetical protein
MKDDREERPEKRLKTLIGPIVSVLKTVAPDIPENRLITSIIRGARKACMPFIQKLLKNLEIYSIVQRSINATQMPHSRTGSQYPDSFAYAYC